MVTLAAIAFSLLIDSAGLVAAMIVSLTIAALGTPETRWKEFAAFLVLMLAIGLGLFIYGLGMPLKVLPWN
jgi:fucose permease